MKIGIIGSGVVGQTLGAKLVERGEDELLRISNRMLYCYRVQGHET